MHPNVHTWPRLLSDALAASYAIWATIREIKRPRISKLDILYQETMQSGHRAGNILARFGGARNCLRIMFLKNRLVIRAHYPFILVARPLGLDLEIPYERIITLKTGNAFLSLRKQVTVEYRTPDGTDRVDFTLRQPDDAFSAIRPYYKLRIIGTDSE